MLRRLIKRKSSTTYLSDYFFRNCMGLYKYFFVLSIITLGYERVDLVPFFGFKVQPSYLFGLPIIYYFLSRIGLSGLLHFFLGVMLFLLYLLIWYAAGYEFYTKRWFLFFFVILLSLSLSFYAVRKLEIACLAKLIYFWAVGQFIFCIIQIYSYLNGDYLTEDFVFTGVFNVSAITWTEGLRLSGSFLDPNRFAFSVVFAMIFLFFIEKNTGVRIRKSNIFSSVLMIFGSLSKSAILSGVVVFFMNRLMFLILLSFLFISFFLFYDILVSRLELGLEQGSSASLHVTLIYLGLDAIGNFNWNEFCFGKGFSSSSLYLQEYFSNSYGNFHNQYLSIIYEMGFLGFFIYFLLNLVFVFRLGVLKAVLFLIPFHMFQVFYSNIGEQVVLFILFYVYFYYRKTLYL